MVLGLSTYKFYDKPDGKDPLRKTLAAMKLPIVVGSGLAFLKLLYSKSLSIDNFATVGHIVKHSFPLCKIALFFSTGTFIAARVRHKDDTLNHVLGALVVAPVMRTYVSFSCTLYCMAIFVIVAYASKSLASDMVVSNEEELMKPSKACNFDWYLWSQAKPSNAPYIKYERD